MSTKVDELRHIIKEMAPMNCSEMNVPLDIHKYIEMIQWLDMEREQCQEIAKEMINNAKSEGKAF